MADYQNDLWNALVALVGEVWPEVKSTGIDRSHEMARTDWEREASAGKLPRCVIDLRPGPASRGGVCNRIERIAITLNYVVGANDVNQCAALVTKLQEMQQALWPTPKTQVLYPAAQVEAYPIASDSMEQVVNQYFLRTRQPFWAGVVMFSVLVGESP